VLVKIPTQQTVIISLCIIDRLTFVMDKACVLSNTQTESLRNVSNVDVPPFYDRLPHPLLLADSWVANGKVTVSGIPVQ
jgi:hypothetical protein